MHPYVRMLAKEKQKVVLGKGEDMLSSAFINKEENQEDTWNKGSQTRANI